MISRSHFLVLFFILTLSLSVFAQSSGSLTGTLDEAWKAIGRLRALIGEIKDALVSFEMQVDENFALFHQRDSDLQGQIDLSNQTHTQDVNALVQEDTHLQTNIDNVDDDLQNFKSEVDSNIGQLNQTDENLQQQINGIHFGIDRGNIYEASTAGTNNTIAYCASPNDILMFGYCMNGIPGSLQTQPSGVFDNFNDGDYTNNPAWSVIAGGGFSVSNFALSQDGSGPGNQAIATSVTPDLNSTMWSLKFRIKTTGFNPGGSNEIDLGVPGFNNYRFLWISSLGSEGRFGLARNDGTILFATSNHYNALDTFYTVELRKNDHVFTITVDSLQDGSGSYVDDTPLTQMTWYSNWQGYVQTIDDINFTYFQPGPSNSALINLGDLNSTTGFECQFGGTARAVCLHQP